MRGHWSGGVFLTSPGEEGRGPKIWKHKLGRDFLVALSFYVVMYDSFLSYPNENCSKDFLPILRLKFAKDKYGWMPKCGGIQSLSENADK